MICPKCGEECAGRVAPTVSLMAYDIEPDRCVGPNEQYVYKH